MQSPEESLMIQSFNKAGTVRLIFCMPVLALMFLLQIQEVSGQQTSGKSAPDILNLSPKDAVDMAIQNNLSLQSAKVTLDNKQRKSSLVWNQFLPTVSVAGVLNRSNWPSTASGSAAVTTMPLNSFLGLPPTVPDIYGVIPYSVDLPRWNVVGSVSASLNFSFAIIAGIQAIHSEYHAGLVTFEKAKLQLERDIRKTYNQILLLENTVALQNEAFANAKKQAQTAEANYQAGLVPRLTWLQAQVQVENLKPAITELENSLKALKGSFAMTLGLPFDTILNLEPFPAGDYYIPLDLADLISKASSGKPDILELQRNIRFLQISRKAIAMQLYTPFLNFSWNMTSAFTKDPWKNNWFSHNDWKGGGNFTITLGMSLNSLLPFTKEGQSLKDMDNTLVSMNIALAQVIHGTELEIYTKLNSLEKTQTSAEVQRAAVELAELSYKLTEEAYRAGLQDFQSVQNSALALSQARLQLLSQQFNYINDLIDLEYAVGVPFGTMSSLMKQE